jgi:hypothetical protein
MHSGQMYGSFSSLYSKGCTGRRRISNATGIFSSFVTLDVYQGSLYFSTMPFSKTTNNFASVKLRRPFVVWLKREAARRSVPMYELVEELCTKGPGRTPIPKSMR